MKNINSHRVFRRNNEADNPHGNYVLYWMQINRRFSYNFALEYAVAMANKLDKPLLIYEGLNCDYPWACDRIHQFMLQGMAEHQRYATGREKSGPVISNLNYYPYLEPKPGSGQGLIQNLAEKACCIISDEYPVYIIKKHNESVPGKLKVPFITIDANGMIPLGITGSEPYSAFIFRKTMQKHFTESFGHPPEENPLARLKNRERAILPDGHLERWPHAGPMLEENDQFLKKLDLKQVGILGIRGTRSAALERLAEFLDHDLDRYGEERNHPDADSTSRLSPWLHFGKISEYEIVMSVLARQPEEWNPGKIRYNNGSRAGFFNGDASIDSFLDEVITWRGTGFHYCHHRPDYDQFTSLPDWALKTLDEHRGDKRPHLYTYEQLENAETSDEVWNAAQRQLRREGIIHNYLRMLWGKKVLEWTPDPETALEYLIELNNQYAIDGRDPNSYSGIFWIFGRFDRAWGPERSIYGKVRYMTSKSARGKLKMSEYLKEFGPSPE
jgi:deoxyribodipyrimidine photo-lyase